MARRRRTASRSWSTSRRRWCRKSSSWSQHLCNEPRSTFSGVGEGGGCDDYTSVDEVIPSKVGSLAHAAAKEPVIAREQVLGRQRDVDLAYRMATRARGNLTQLT